MGTSGLITCLLDPVFIGTERNTLSDVDHIFQQGRPVALKTEGKWKLIFPRNVVAYPSTRLLIDLPSEEVPSFDISIDPADAAFKLDSESAEFGLVFKDDKLKGLLSKKRLLNYLITEARKCGLMERFLEDGLSMSHTLVWRVPVSEDGGDRIPQELPAVIELHGPAMEILGFPVKAFSESKKPWKDCIHPDDRKKILDAAKMVTKAGITRLYTYRYFHPNGRVLWLQETLSREEGKKRPYLRGITTDITDFMFAVSTENILSRVHRVIARRRPGDSIISSFAYLADDIRALDAAEFLIWEKGLRGYRRGKEWIRPESKKVFSPIFKRLYRGKRQRRIPTEKSYTAEVERTGISLYIPDTSQSSFWGDDIRAKNGCFSSLVLPLVKKDEFKAVLIFYSTKKYGFSEWERLVLENLKAPFAAAVEAWHYEEALKKLNSLLEEKVRRRTYELEVLYELSQQLDYNLSYSEMLQTTAEYLSRVINCTAVVMAFKTEGGLNMNVYFSHPISEKAVNRIRALVLSEFEKAGISPLPQGKVEQKRIPTKSAGKKLKPVVNLGSIILEPVKSVEDLSTIGFLLMGAEKADAFDENHIKVLSTVADQVAISIRRIHALVQSEQNRLERVVECLPEGVLLLNKNREVVLTNPKGREFLGVLGVKNVKERIEYLGKVSIDRLLEPPPGQNEWHTIEIKEPERRIFEISSLSFKHRAEEEGWIMVLRDATREHEIDEHIHQQELLASVGRLAAGIAHDFNNILTAMIGVSQYLCMEEDIPQYAREHLKTIEEQGMRAADLIRQILDFSRKSIVEFSVQDVVQLIKQTGCLLERTIPENIKIELKIKIDHAPVRSNPTHLQQVITNLAVNARDAMPEGGTITIELSRIDFLDSEEVPFPGMGSGAWVILTVRDTGYGIPEEQLPYIFDPFFTTKDVGKGTGLGLSQVYGIVKQHNGYIDVKSREGEGTTFFIYLPMIEEEEKRDEGEHILKRAPGRKILVVEDEESVLKVVSLMLAQLGYRIVTASSGRQALEKIDRLGDEIELVLTDMVMPDMRGDDLAGIIKNKLPHIKVVGMSGYPLGTEERGVESCGLNGWITKPLEVESLSETLKKAFGE
ncbi:MAG: hypothetical protein DRP87_05075 [Spirochaetes bacterium]|nr:MAG: hypothetical protein DRP87_05075 [Spirochaetota bacterium]